VAAATADSIQQLVNQQQLITPPTSREQKCYQFRGDFVAAAAWKETNASQQTGPAPVTLIERLPRFCVLQPSFTVIFLIAFISFSTTSLGELYGVRKDFESAGRRYGPLHEAFMAARFAGVLEFLRNQRQVKLESDRPFCLSGGDRTRNLLACSFTPLRLASVTLAIRFHKRGRKHSSLLRKELCSAPHKSARLADRIWSSV